MVVTSHPARNRSGFAGLRLVSDPRPEHEPEPVFTVQVTVADGKVSIEWDPKTPDVVWKLNDVGDVIAAAVHALLSDQNIEDRIQGAYERKRSWREAAVARQEEFEQTHPWICACGNRAKTSAGLDSHIRAGNPRCGRG